MNQQNQLDSVTSSNNPIKLTKFKASFPLGEKSIDFAQVGKASVGNQNNFDKARIEFAEDGHNNNSDTSKKPAFIKSLRYYVMLLALFSPFVTTYSRTIINFAITDMIDYSDQKPPQIESATATISTMSQNGSKNNQEYFFDLDRSCPIDDEVRSRLISENQHDIERAHSGKGEKYKWGSFEQGLLKAAYAIGHAPFQIPGSRLSEIYGSHRIMSTVSLLTAICCFAAPYLASLHFYLVFTDLILLGILGSFVTPALITLFSNWLSPGEKSMMLSFYLIASRLGLAMSSFLCGLLIQAQYSWRYIFFSASWISFAYSIIFFLCARSRPRDHPLIRQKELDYLAIKNTLVRESLSQQQQQHQDIELSMESGKKEDPIKKERKTFAPWLAISTNASVLAFIVTKFCVKLAGDTVQIELPSYLKNVMHFSARDNGTINALNYVIFCLCCLLVGNLSKYIVKKKPLGLSKTTIRKCFQCFASFGVTLVLIGAAFSVCNNTYTRFWFILFFFFTTFSTGGEAQIPLDITERYSGTIHAIGSSLAISGAIEPPLVGFLIRGHAADKDSWKGVWIGASVISFIGGIVFLLFADANTQSFDSIGNQNEDLDGADNEAFENDTVSKDNKKKGNISKHIKVPIS